MRFRQKTKKISFLKKAKKNTLQSSKTTNFRRYVVFFDKKAWRFRHHADLRLSTRPFLSVMHNFARDRIRFANQREFVKSSLIWLFSAERRQPRSAIFGRNVWQKNSIFFDRNPTVLLKNSEFMNWPEVSLWTASWVFRGVIGTVRLPPVGSGHGFPPRFSL